MNGTIPRDLNERRSTLITTAYDTTEWVPDRERELVFRLSALAARDYLAPLHRAGFTGVTLFGVTELFDRPVAVRSKKSDWVVMPLEHDPLWQQGRYPMPERNRRELAGILQLRDFAGTYTAHELPEGGYERLRSDPRALPELVAPETNPELKRLSHSLDAVDRRRQRLAELGKSAAPFVAGAGIALVPLLVMGTVAVASVAAAPLALADPIIFGVVQDPPDGGLHPGRPAAFIALTAWHWPVSGDVR